MNRSHSSPLALHHASLLLVLAAQAATAPAAPRPRFVARLADDALVEGDQLTNWHSADSLPQLNDRPLLDPSHPLLWLWDRSLQPAATPPAFVEMWSGDRLPGKPLAFEAASAADATRRFACWRVRPGVEFRPPRPVAESLVHVEARWVRRIVWRGRPGMAYRPGTALLAGRGEVAFRSARLAEDSVLLLLSEGTRRIGFEELDELHLPAGDPWPLCFDELAVLAPHGQSRLLQLETDEGLVATASLERFAAYSLGGSKDPDRWVHGIQPAWSRELLWVPHGRIAIRRCWAFADVPLTRIPAESSAPGPMADDGGTALWPPQVNRSVQGGLLRGGQRLFGWGFGVHAPQQLRFPLPNLPATLQTRVGLDALAGDGGCVGARIRWPSASTAPAYESPLLVGSRRIESSGRLQLDPSRDPSDRLILELDSAHEARPQGADPFHIRDTADWFEPVVRFDSAALSRAVADRTAAQLAAWQGWKAVLPGDARWRALLRETSGASGEFLTGLGLERQPLSLTRQLRLTDRDRWLLIVVSQDRAPRRRPSLEVHADGRQISKQEVPFNDKWRNQAEPLVISLADASGQGADAGPAAGSPSDRPEDAAGAASPTQEPQRPPGGERNVELEIRLVPGDEPTPIYWQQIAIAERLPMLRVLLEGSGGSDDAAASAAPAVPDTRPSSPERTLRIPAGRRVRLSIDPPLPIRADPRWGEYRFLRFVFRKVGGGSFSIELEAVKPGEEPCRYEAGPDAPADAGTRRLWDRPLENRPISADRDVHADFGSGDLAALVVEAQGGGELVLEQVSAARSPGDFRYLEQESR